LAEGLGLRDRPEKNFVKELPVAIAMAIVAFIVTVYVFHAYAPARVGATPDLQESATFCNLFGRPQNGFMILVR
jgi:hypothetical protein